MGRQPKRRAKTAAAWPRVWINIPTDSHWGREALRGIVPHARLHSWRLQPGRVDDPTTIPGALEALGVVPGSTPPHAESLGGILARVATPALAAAIHRSGVPAVNVSNLLIDGPELPRVCIDLAACASLAADHLAGLGVRSFVYVGQSGFRDAQRQHAAFAARLGRHAADVPAVWFRNVGPNEEAMFRQAVEDLPKPLGVFARHMALAQSACRILVASGMHVPESVVVVSGDDDPLLAEMSTPNVSAIDVGSDRIGARAAELLQDLMAGQAAPREPILVPPLGIVARGSTDIVPTANADLVTAIRFIRANLARPVRVEDLVRETHLSRRMLFQAFHDELGRSPQQEIRRMRLAHAQSLLASGEQSLEKVARLSGFGTSRYMARVFMNELGEPPSAFRRRLL
jgi:LacI family transcriptional regulator